jgi:hypothetical protein
MSFTLFHKLALELRRKIWFFAASSPRFLNTQHLQMISRATNFVSLMATSQESREMAIEFYELTPEDLSWYFMGCNILLLKGNPSNRNSSWPEAGGGS